MSVITLTVDGDLVSARSGETILAVLREHGVRIPTLCQLDGLSARGGCRLCLVEVQGAPALVAACTTTAVEGQVVTTTTPRLLAYRKMIVELMLAERNHVCAVCVANGHCELQSLAAELGIDHVRYRYLHPDLPLDASHERFVLDHNRCVLCTRCVRVCDEIEGAHTWDLAGRGVDSRVIADLNVPWGDSRSCTGCGKCVQVCPTGALARRGATVAEMERNPGFLTWILGGRERNVWEHEGMG